jgi:phosphoglycerate dehydrogenase-like enzyme
MKIAILDDYQNVALKLADWSDVAHRAEITVFNDHVADPSAVVERLLRFDIVCVMRERTPLPRDIIQQLPQLKLIASTGARNASIDEAAARERGITITATRYWSTPTIELTWALILASMRHIVRENTAIHDGGWQTSIGEDVGGKTLGVPDHALAATLTQLLAAAPHSDPIGMTGTDALHQTPLDQGHHDFHLG